MDGLVGAVGNGITGLLGGAMDAIGGALRGIVSDLRAPGRRSLDPGQALTGRSALAAFAGFRHPVQNPRLRTWPESGATGAKEEAPCAIACLRC